ncbi:hypothetical protein [Ahrensia sp. R2A130]|uniref:hypothetical protein n=1 Tax=Ahrensia sp. R2A130 TaxID=744979 RepID=UPI0001E0BCD9|nr:hypothetical protein [Ahrensia sp. R2A130]EFL87813.1 conserved hypothetical protein [Ahrensia sp. R2A130]
MRLLLAALLMISTAQAGQRKLDGAAVAALLPTIIATGQDTRQTFSEAGATTYSFKGRDSYGSWRVQGDQYCSQWPPADGWACFDLLADDELKTIVWLDASGERIVNHIAAKN